MEHAVTEWKRFIIVLVDWMYLHVASTLPQRKA